MSMVAFSAWFGSPLDRRLGKQYRHIEIDRREPFYVLFGHRVATPAPSRALREIVGVAQAPLTPTIPRDSR